MTEFLLQTWESGDGRDDLEILTMQWRSLAKHDAFKVTVAGRHTQLQPDGMFLYRQHAESHRLLAKLIWLRTCDLQHHIEVENTPSASHTLIALSY
ncbi:MAG: hypothetical protein WEB58_17045 [Planctomycetaceae bacterium]